MGHLVGQQVTTGGPPQRKTPIVAKNNRSPASVVSKRKVTIVLICMPSIYPQVQPLTWSASPGAGKIAVLYSDWGRSHVVLRRMLKAMVGAAPEEALHDKVA